MAEEILGELDRDVARRIASKYDAGRERAVQAWVEQVVGYSFPEATFHESLKNGIILCELINAVIPGTVKKINRRSMPFLERENIANYLNGCRDNGMALVDLFDTQDLYENKNVVSVIDNLYAFAAFARTQSTFSGPYLEGTGGSGGRAVTGHSSAAPVIDRTTTHFRGITVDPEEKKRNESRAAERRREREIAAAAEGDEDYVLGELDRDVRNKIMARYDPAQEAEVRAWIESVTGRSIGDDFLEGLKSGVIMCNMLNTISPGMVSGISSKSGAFFQRENISKYLTALMDSGMHMTDLFDTDDLYEKKNIVNVIQHFYALNNWAKTVRTFSGPFIN
jgi:hypothetical protein